MVSDESHEQYYRRRAAEEKAVAENSVTQRDRDLHAELAVHYAARAETPHVPVVWE